MHQGLWLPEGSAVHDAVLSARMATEALWAKTPFGGLRWLHFLALAYLAWLWAGPEGVRLRQPLGASGALRGAWPAALAAVAALTAPYVYAQEIRALAPALDAAIVAVYGGAGLLIGDKWIGIAQLVHLAAMVPLVWWALPAQARDRLRGPVWMRFVETVRKVGSQSLAVFLASMALAQVGGFAFDILGTDVWTRASVNLTGMALLVATAYGVSWFKRQPWRMPARTATVAPAADAQPVAAAR